MLLNVVVLPDSRSYATLRVHSIRFGDFRLRENGYTSRLRQIDSSTQTGDSAADYDVIGVMRYISHVL